MGFGRRSRSLYWRIAGSFLAVLVIALLLQWLLVLLVVEPAAARWAQARLRAQAQESARALERAWAVDPQIPARQVLAAQQPFPARTHLVYRDPEGNLTAAMPLPRGMRRRIEALLSEHGVGSRGLRPPDRPVPSRDGERRGWPHPEGEVPPQFIIAERIGVEVAGQTRGQLIVLRSGMPRWRVLPRETPRPLLLFVPAAILVAAIGGLLIFRPLVRRIRALEELARKVGSGNLSARVDDPGEDEIGRLGAQMNEMSANLQRARAELETVDRQRRRLLGDISHELATPLTTIRGYAETLLEPGLPLEPSERERYLADVLAESERMQSLLQDLLELSRLESGSIELHLEHIELVALVRRSVARLSPRFERAGLQLQWEATSADRAEIMADGRRIEQIVENLLGNALRYAQQGNFVKVAVQQVATRGRGDPARVELTVEDDGPGFPEQDLPHVFERFFRSDRSRATEGSGLGLAIVREIARLHGGDVRAENRRPQGARIVVSFAMN